MRASAWIIVTALCVGVTTATLPVLAELPPTGKRTSPPASPKSPEDREKALANLYAHLATTDSEESAKTTAEAIERLWLYSGSDTINLLMERAQVAINEKNLELARKLLDYIVELAPDF